MSFVNPAREEISALLRGAHNIAVVGLSSDTARPSHGVAQRLQQFGYRIFPVTPNPTKILGEPTHPTLDALFASLPSGERIDIVNVFRRPEHVRAIVDDSIRLGVSALWLQLGVVDERSAARARAAGIFVVMDRCLYRDRAALAA